MARNFFRLSARTRSRGFLPTRSTVEIGTWSAGAWWASQAPATTSPIGCPGKTRRTRVLPSVYPVARRAFAAERGAQSSGT